MQNKYEITLNDFKKIENDAVIIDVRMPGEVASGMIKGAVNLPLPRLVAEIGSVAGNDKSKKIVLVCASGSRSMMAAIMTQDLGYKNAVSLKGGMSGYVNN